MIPSAKPLRNLKCLPSSAFLVIAANKRGASGSSGRINDDHSPPDRRILSRADSIVRLSSTENAVTRIRQAWQGKFGRDACRFWTAHRPFPKLAITFMSLRSWDEMDESVELLGRVTEAIVACYYFESPKWSQVCRSSSVARSPKQALPSPNAGADTGRATCKRFRFLVAWYPYAAHAAPGC